MAMKSAKGTPSSRSASAGSCSPSHPRSASSVERRLNAWHSSSATTPMLVSPVSSGMIHSQYPVPQRCTVESHRFLSTSRSCHCLARSSTSSPIKTRSSTRNQAACACGSIGRWSPSFLARRRRRPVASTTQRASMSTGSPPPRVFTATTLWGSPTSTSRTPQPSRRSTPSSSQRARRSFSRRPAVDLVGVDARRLARAHLAARLDGRGMHPAEEAEPVLLEVALDQVVVEPEHVARGSARRSRRSTPPPCGWPRGAGRRLRSRTTTEADGRRRLSCKASVRPAMPPPKMATSSVMRPGILARGARRARGLGCAS